MAKINQDLLKRLEKKLAVSRARVYALISAKVRDTFLTPNLAAIALANEHGIGITRFASEDDLAAIRHAKPAALQGPATPAPSNKTQRTSALSKKRRKSSKQAKRKTAKSKKIFVVHGRNETIRIDLFRLLRAMGLEPMEWNDAVKASKKPAPFIGEILGAAFTQAAAVIVLFTPDDKARLKKKFQKKGEDDFEKRLTGQARPNVLFEAGMAFGHKSQNTVLVQVGNVRPFSDIAGRHIVHLSNSLASRQDLATKLENAGCLVDRSGTDWLEEGKFQI